MRKFIFVFITFFFGLRGDGEQSSAGLVASRAFGDAAKYGQKFKGDIDSLKKALEKNKGTKRQRDHADYLRIKMKERLQLLWDILNAQIALRDNAQTIKKYADNNKDADIIDFLLGITKEEDFKKFIDNLEALHQDKMDKDTTESIDYIGQISEDIDAMSAKLQEAKGDEKIEITLKCPKKNCPPISSDMREKMRLKKNPVPSASQAGISAPPAQQQQQPTPPAGTPTPGVPVAIASLPALTTPQQQQDQTASQQQQTAVQQAQTAAQQQQTQQTVTQQQQTASQQQDTQQQQNQTAVQQNQIALQQNQARQTAALQQIDVQQQNTQQQQNRVALQQQQTQQQQQQTEQRQLQMQPQLTELQKVQQQSAIK